MAQTPVQYRKLPGSRNSTGLVTYSHLWLGPDHLLAVEQTGYKEKYKRFYYRDIQALIIRQTPRRIYWSLVLFSHAGLWGLIMLGGEIMTFIGGVICLFSLLLLVVNLLMGPTCVGYLRTAAQEAKLISLRRFNGARLAQEALRAEIAKAQGLLDNDALRAGSINILERAHPAAAASQAVLPNRPVGEGLPKLAQPLKQFSRVIHALTFITLAALGLCNLACTIDPTWGIISLQSMVNLLFFALIIATLINQHQSNAPSAMRKISWLSFGLPFVQLFIVFCVMIMAVINDPINNNPDMMGPAIIYERLRAGDSVLLWNYGISGVCALLFGLLGLLLIYDQARQPKLTPATSPDEAPSATSPEESANG